MKTGSTLPPDNPHREPPNLLSRLLFPPLLKNKQSWHTKQAVVSETSIKRQSLREDGGESKKEEGERERERAEIFLLFVPGECIG